MEIAQKVLKTRRDEVRACAKRSGKRRGTPATGKVVLTLALGPEGTPDKIVVSQDEVGDPLLRECLKKALDVPFPNPYQKRCLIQAPFQFSGDIGVR